MTLTPLGSTKNRKTLYNKGEQKLAKRLEGLRRPGSGSFDGYKGDVITREFLIDQKTTEHGSFRLTGGILNKITFEARQAGKHPAVEIELAVAPTTPKEWMLIPLDVFNEYRKLSDAIEKGEVKKKEDSEDSTPGTGKSGSDPRTGGRGGAGWDSGRASTSDAGREETEEDIIEVETSQAEEKKQGKDARLGDTCYNSPAGTGGIRFNF